MFTLESAINRGVKIIENLGPFGYFPSVVTEPREELLACRETAWIGTFLNLSPVYDISGPDAIKLLNYVCVNRDFSTLKIRGSRHVLMCNEKGQLLADGLLIRTGEESFRTYWLAPVLAFYVDTLGMNVEGAWVKDEYFFQIDGPKSLEILEKASQTDLHDMKFAGRKNVKIMGTDVTVIRLGMSGALAYEIHGNIHHADLVYDAVVDAGKEFGLKRLGNRQYCKNHTQGGYPNQFIHFWYPWFTSGDDLKEYIEEYSKGSWILDHYSFFGSANDDVENFFITPYDIKWDYLIKYDNDFIGREALEEIGKNPPRTCVTLEWNAEDVGQVFASQFRGTDVEPIDNISRIGDDDDQPSFRASKVLLDGNMVGITAGRTQDFYHRRMISLAFIRREHAVEGKELKVLWGTNGSPQMEIRARVAPFPYYQEEYRNETFDVEKIPRPSFDKISDETLDGIYNIVVKSPTGDMEGSFHYTTKDGVVTGTATTLGSTVEVVDGIIVGNIFTHTMKVKLGIGRVKITVKGEVNGDSISGVFKTSFGTMSFEGKKINEF
ncbi:MAG TPA: aminomethyl transferase family protein [Candidatus Merdenecus merdavium]|nr:aminomethyl transferase family protein [Candidatus Merdenecus merdavium]